MSLTLETIADLYRKLGDARVAGGQRVVMSHETVARLRDLSVSGPIIMPAPEGCTLLGFPVVYSDVVPRDQAFLVVPDSSWYRPPVFAPFAWTPTETRGHRRRRVKRLQRDAKLARVQGWTMTEAW